MRKVLCLLSSFVLVTTPGTVAAQTYEPQSSFPTNGVELVLIFISSSTCTGNREERLGDVVMQMKRQLGDRAEREGKTFYAVGAAVEWSVEQGIDYLLRGIAPGYSDKNFGMWDEVWVGRDWLNNAGIQYMWRGDGLSVIPQLVVVERTVEMGERGIQVGHDKIVARVVGSQQIIAWFDDNMPFQVQAGSAP